MSVKTIVAINQADITIANLGNIVQLTGSSWGNIVQSDGTPRTIQEWLIYIFGKESRFSGDVKTTEFTEITVTDSTSMKFLNEDLADALGFPYNTTVTPDSGVIYYGTSWGNNRLILQGSESTDSKGVTWISRMLAPERVNGKVNNESWESVNYVVNSYDSRFDLKRWKVPSNWLGTDKEQWVRDFLNSCGSGRDSDEVIIYGDGHWIKDTETWKCLNDQYSGIDIDLGHALLVKFMVGFRLVTT